MEKPRGSKIKHWVDADTATFSMPAAGISGLAVYKLLFGLLLLYPPGHILWLRGSAVVNMNPAGLAFLSGMAVLGIVVLMLAADSMLQKSTVELTRHTLTISTRGPVKNSLKQWRREDVSDVREQSSNIEVDHKRLHHLVVQSGQTAQGYLLNRDKAELQWLALELRRALQLESSSPG